MSNTFSKPQIRRKEVIASVALHNYMRGHLHLPELTLRVVGSRTFVYLKTENPEIEEIERQEAERLAALNRAADCEDCE